VLEYRLKNEYGVEVIRSNMPYQFIRWIKGENVDVKNLNITSDTKWVQDFKGNDLLVFTSEWNINWALDKNSGLILEEFSKE
ncbi:MAG: peptide chain release factor 3, partial [Clostridia bacterium]|nr:peptide chain release factor 3 [Clostridia bacterium]